jgi:hypothetical protein
VPAPGNAKVSNTEIKQTPFYTHLRGPGTEESHLEPIASWKKRGCAGRLNVIANTLPGTRTCHNTPAAGCIPLTYIRVPEQSDNQTSANIVREMTERRPHRNNKATYRRRTDNRNTTRNSGAHIETISQRTDNEWKQPKYPKRSITSVMIRPLRTVRFCVYNKLES